MTHVATTELVQLSSPRGGEWPLLVPRALLTQYQAALGAEATLLWLNLYEMAEQGATESVVYSSVFTELGARTGMDGRSVERAVAALEEAGLLRRSDGNWLLGWPGPTPSQRSEVGQHVQVDEPDDDDFGGVEPVEEASGWNSDEAALQAVVQFYHQRIGMLGPSQFEKLRFWVEEQGMSSDVVALAIEETVQSANTPRMAYVEGVLRNWYNEGIRTLAHLQKSKRARSQEVPPTTEGSPNAASFDAVDRDAVRRWREMYSDEYDD